MSKKTEPVDDVSVIGYIHPAHEAGWDSPAPVVCPVDYGSFAVVEEVPTPTERPKSATPKES